MNVVDSSGWFEYFADGPQAEHFAPAIEAVDKLLVPSIAVLEVFKRVLQQRNEGAALQAVALMEQGRIIDLDLAGALEAARLGAEYRLPLADSVILAVATRHRATLWTEDSHFKGLPGVKYFERAR
jgi:predicted nucleic acid-binding protein